MANNDMANLKIETLFVFVRHSKCMKRLMIDITFIVSTARMHSLG